jgi:hypothetical protein
MKANELRIGNLGIDTDGRLCSVEEIYKNEPPRIVAIKGGLTALPVKPIPLTEEWLLKFGFIRKHFDMKIKGLKLTASTRIIASDKLSAFHHKKVGFISSVHQLQNLYFALTGEELTLNKN